MQQGPGRRKRGTPSGPREAFLAYHGPGGNRTGTALVVAGCAVVLALVGGLLGRFDLGFRTVAAAARPRPASAGQASLGSGRDLLGNCGGWPRPVLNEGGATNIAATPATWVWVDRAGWHVSVAGYTVTNSDRPQPVTVVVTGGGGAPVPAPGTTPPPVVKGNRLTFTATLPAVSHARFDFTTPCSVQRLSIVITLGTGRAMDAESIVLGTGVTPAPSVLYFVRAK